MRGYFFGNFYLSSIQQGIQAAHALANLTSKYRKDSQQTDFIYDWADNHQTMILLNGGDMQGLISLIKSFEDNNNPYPWAFFTESEGALNKTITSVGIILPEKIYMGAYYYRMAGIQNGITVEDGVLSDGLYIKVENCSIDPEFYMEERFNAFETWLVKNLQTFQLAK